MVFAELKVGDEVAVMASNSNYMRRVVVTNVTPTTFAAGGDTWHRKDGSLRGGSKWRFDMAFTLDNPLARERLSRQEYEAKRDRVLAALSTATPEVRAQVFALLGV